MRRGAHTELARLTVGCCAADARPNRVRLVGDLGVVAPEPDVWLLVRGKVVRGSATAESGYVPVLEVAGVVVVEAPADPYEY